MEVVVAGVPVSSLRNKPSACQCPDCRNGSNVVSHIKLDETCDKRSNRFFGGLGNGVSVSVILSAMVPINNTEDHVLSTENYTVP